MIEGAVDAHGMAQFLLELPVFHGFGKSFHDLKGLAGI